jgi:hypothetical protein
MKTITLITRLSDEANRNFIDTEIGREIRELRVADTVAIILPGGATFTCKWRSERWGIALDILLSELRRGHRLLVRRGHFGGATVEVC